MNKDEALKFMKEIKENRTKLDACSKHNFSIDITPNRTINKKFRCISCDGIVSVQEKLWYEKGLKDANK